MTQREVDDTVGGWLVLPTGAQEPVQVDQWTAETLIKQGRAKRCAFHYINKSGPATASVIIDDADTVIINRVIG